jgi:hypothetical protein
MNKLVFRFISTVGLVSSSLCWLIAMPAHAAKQYVSEPILDTQEEQVCVLSTHSRFNLVCERVSQLKDQSQAKPLDLATDPFSSPEYVEFTAEESNAALALFGCDCPLCINALRNLRTMSAS